MRISFLIRSLDFGGAERQLVLLAKGLHEQGHLVSVVVFYSNGPLEEDLRRAGVEVRLLNKGSRWDIAAFLLRLIRLLKHERPSTIYSFLAVPNVLAVILKPFFPRTRVVWGVRASNVDLRRYDWLARLVWWVECRLARFTDSIIVNSQAGFRYAAAHGFPKHRMVVIPNGIDTDRFCPDPNSRRRVREEWGIPEHVTVIGLVGRLDPMKGHPTFLKAAERMMRRRHDVRFVCVGDGSSVYRADLQRLCAELGLADRVLWAGKCVDMPAIYNGLDVCTSSSAYGEGFPNVIGEAMACGKVCVVTDVGDSAWIVGRTGEVVPAEDHVALSEAWNVLIERKSFRQDLLERGEDARKRIVGVFTTSALLEDTSKVLKNSGRGCV